MMNNNKVVETLSRFISKELIDSVGDVTIYQNGHGSYVLFNKYSISRNRNDEYVVTVDTESIILSSLKTAVTWCIYDFRHKTSDALRIVELDQRLSSIDVSISNHKKLIKKLPDINDVYIHLAKLSGEQVKRKDVQYQLAEYIAESKKWQQKKFNKVR